ncbi:MAG: septum formation initiator family protein [Desulfosoma sp.]
MKWDWHELIGRWGTIALVVFLAAMDLLLFRAVFFSSKGLQGYQNKRRQVAVLEEKVTQLRKEVQKLYLQTQKFKEDPLYAERYLRQNLDLIREDEIVVRFTPPQRDSSPHSQKNEAAQPPKGTQRP